MTIYRAPCYGRLLYAPISPTFPFWLARAIREFQPDLLHLHLPNTSAFWALLVPAARRLPWVIHWHADVVASTIDRRLALAYRLYRPFEQRLLAASRRSSPPRRPIWRPALPSPPGANAATSSRSASTRRASLTPISLLWNARKPGGG